MKKILCFIFGHKIDYKSRDSWVESDFTDEGGEHYFSQQCKRCGEYIVWPYEKVTIIKDKIYLK